MKHLLHILVLVLFAVGSTYAQATVTGTVLSGEDNSPLIGVTVLVKGTSQGTVTDMDGKYSISVAGDDAVLVFSYVGFKTQEVTVGSQSKIDVTLSTDQEMLDEVVVTAVGISRDKKELGYAVQQVSTDELTGAQEVNLGSALSAKAAGVSVVTNSGVPGASATIRIRGSNSITGSNSPLFVVDGIPIDNSISGQNTGTDGVSNSNRLIDINPEDIAEMSVLKGAAATALYGTRAANGAIIIKTKSGSFNSKMKVSFKASVDVSEYQQVTPLNKTYSQGIGGKYGYPSTAFSPSAVSWGAKISDLVWVPSQENKWDKNGAVMTAAEAQSQGLASVPMTPYNNVNDYFQTGVTQDYYLSLSGGSNKSTYYVSAGHLHSSGIVPNSDFTRTTFKVNVQNKFTEKFSSSFSGQYATSGGYRIQQGSNTSGVMLGLLRTPPSFDNSNGYGQDGYKHEDAYLFPDGSQRNYRGGGGYDNPNWVSNVIPHLDEVNRLIGSLQFTYKATDWMNITYQLGLDTYTDRRTQGFEVGSRANPGGTVWERQLFSRDINSDLFVTFDKKVNDDLNVRVLIGHNYFDTHFQDFKTQGDGLSVPDFYHLSNASSYTPSDSETRVKRTGIYLDGTVSYKDYLHLSFTGRNDWSSTLPSDNNSYFYPSASLSFNFDQLVDFDPLYFGKLRVSWGRVGRDASAYSTDNYFTGIIFNDGTINTIADGWTNGIGFPYNGVSGFTKSSVLGSDKLEPEFTSTLEFGLETQFLNGRVGLDLTYYSSLTEGAIIPVELSPATGYQRFVQNAAEISNKGVEVVLSGTPVKLESGFQWDLSVNYTKYTNIVESLADGVETITLGGFTGTSSRAVAGEPYGVIYGGAWKRNAAGKLVIGADGYPIVDSEEQVLGDPNPDWMMGINNSFSYKGLTVTALFDIRKGGQIWNGTKGALSFFGASELTAVNREKTTVFDGVVQTLDAEGNVVSEEPNTTEVPLDENWYLGNGGGFGSQAEDFVEDAGWVRLRNVSISYKLPKAMLSKTKLIKDLQITLSGRNLWLKTDFDGIDPETNLTGAGNSSRSQNAMGLEYFNMPNTKSYSATIRVGF